MWEMVCDGNVKCWLDLSSVGKKGKLYDWKNSVGCKINIRYKYLQDEVEERQFEIIGYNNPKLTLKWNNEVYEIRLHCMLEGKCGNIFDKKTLRFKYEIGQKVNGLTIIDRCYKQYKSQQLKYYKYRCENGHEHGVMESSLKKGHGCPSCSDGIPITEKFMSNLLVLKNIDFIFQASKRNFDWIKNNKFYDFALPTYNKTIIEIDGDPRSHGDRENDNYKDETARTNGWSIIRINLLENYTGSFEQLWNAYKPVLNDLGIHITKKEARECYVKSQTSIFHLIINITNENPEFSQQQITNELKEKYGYQLAQQTISNYLKKSNELGSTNYEIIPIMQKRAIICVTTNKIYESSIEASRQTGIVQSSISNCCRGKLKSAGKHPETGEKLVWRYYEESL